MSRLLLDANLSPSLAEALRWRGHDALHVNELGLRTAADTVIFRRATELQRTIITHDDDYLRLLRECGGAGPSVIHVSQRELQRNPLVGRLAQAAQLGQVLGELEPRLAQGVAVRLDRGGMRVDPLPLRSAERGFERAQAAPRPPPERTVKARVRERVRERRLEAPGRDR